VCGKNYARHHRVDVWTVDTVKRLEDAGCAAVVLHSLFEEQVAMAQERRVAHMNPDDARFAEMIDYFPAASDYAYSPDQYAEHLHRVTQPVKIPVIGSLNGRTAESWLDFARVIEQAGALCTPQPRPVVRSVMRKALEQWLDWNKMGSLADARGRLSLKTTQDLWCDRLSRRARRVVAPSCQ
jgi:hypothetical protein